MMDGSVYIAAAILLIVGAVYQIWRERRKPK
jgi:hypothetical protein